jgi:hypothetical protein
MATSVRTMSGIRRVFTYNAQKAVAVRGTADQLDLAAWLMTELDQPAHVSSPYTTAAGPSNVVRVFFLKPSALSPASATSEFQNIAVNVRTGVNIRQVFTYTPTWAIVMRGSEDQMTAAEKMLEGKLVASAR